MKAADERLHWSSLVDMPRDANLLLASPNRRPIDPIRALAIVASEAAATAASSLRSVAETISQDLGDAIGMR